MEVEFLAILQKALNVPGVVNEAYRAFQNYSIGNQILAAMQLTAKGLPVSPIASFNAWKEKGRTERVLMRRIFSMWRLVRKDLGLLWFAIRHPSRPAWLLPVAGLLALYALVPLNLAIPLLGVVDDFVLVPLVLHTLLKLLPPEIRFGFGAQRQAAV